jgi:hypothetical protein
MTRQLSHYGVKPTMDWKRTPGCFGGQNGASYHLVGTKYYVRHCGHPTANWPYYGLRPDGSMILAPSGYAFQFLQDAKAATEAEYRKSQSKGGAA